MQVLCYFPRELNRVNKMAFPWSKLTSEGSKGKNPKGTHTDFSICAVNFTKDAPMEISKADGKIY